MTTDALLSPIGNEPGLFVVFCPGCKNHHPISTTERDYDGPKWTFNGNMESPTFSPSLLCFKDNPGLRCHSFIRDGKWQFLNDCHHELAGKTVPMVPANF